MDEISKSDKYKKVGKELILTGCASVPATSGLVRQLDKIESDRNFDEIRAEIENIWINIGKHPVTIESQLMNFIEIIQNTGIEIDFRKVKSCLAIMKELSQKSSEAHLADPMLDNDRCIELINERHKPDDPQLELKLVAYELKKEGMVCLRKDMNSPIGFRSIYPANDFFWKSDHIFQEWNPRDDAREICKFVINNERDCQSARTQLLAESFNWKPRRLNPALAYLYFNGQIHQDRKLGGIKHILQSIRLTEDSHFFVDDEIK